MEGVSSKPSKTTKRKQAATKAPRSAPSGVAKKKRAPKTPKPPRNPFRRSDTGKLKLKCIQMRKRIETLTPRAALMRERLDTTEARLNFLTGKVKLVDEELASRAMTVDTETPIEEAPEAMTSDAESSDEEIEELQDACCVAGSCHANVCEAETSDDDDDIELDDEIEPDGGNAP